jgi:hypothetical protein
MLEVILVLIVLLMIFSVTYPVLGRWAVRIQRTPTSKVDSSNSFHCMVELIGTNSPDSTETAFEVKMRGCVSAPSDMCDADVQVLIADVQDGPNNAKPVLCTAKQWQMEDSPAFCFKSHIGRLPHRKTHLSTWVQIAGIRADLLRFPRKGTRRLKFITSIISQAGGGALACAAATIDYENHKSGYIDAKENHQRAEALSMQLAAALCSSNGQLNKAGIEVIDEWISCRVEASVNKESKAQTRSRLNRSLEDALGFCRKGEQVDIESICGQMTETATIVQRYDVMELCLWVVRAAGTVASNQTTLLSRMADMLEVDADKFRAMVQKILPVSSYEAKDMEFILGITADMSAEEARRQLNSEYRKWNARVTHPDTATRQQAGRMLALIADVRREYVEQAHAVQSD